VKATRQNKIRALIDDRGAMTVGELITLLSVSEATIRRDLNEMHQDGIVKRTHGGALRLERVAPEPPLTQRYEVMDAEKARIAQRAAQMVSPGDTVFLGGGTTVKLMAQHLRDMDDLAVVTNSLPIIETLKGVDSIALIIIGGLLRHRELSIVGSLAIEAIERFRADYVFMGMRAVHPRHGFTGEAIEEAVTDRAAFGIGAQVVVLVDHTKFGGVSTVHIAPTNAADLIVTDDGVDPAMVEELEAAGTRVVIAGEDR
jgi:DeoR family fructose operon transcriptional repressor